MLDAKQLLDDAPKSKIRCIVFYVVCKSFQDAHACRPTTFEEGFDERGFADARLANNKNQAGVSPIEKSSKLLQFIHSVNEVVANRSPFRTYGSQRDESRNRRANAGDLHRPWALKVDEAG